MIESCTIRTHYELLCNLFSVRGVCISNFAGTYAHAWVQNPIIHRIIIKKIEKIFYIIQIQSQ